MREIKFRGKRKDTGEWVYGYFTRNDESGSCYITTQSKTGGAHPWEVDPATVGQYTGLKDKNDEKIYEGDIVEIYEGDIIVGTYKDIGIDIGLVVFKGCGFKVEIPNVGDDELVDWERYSDSIEVIGNIHDNPELLEVHP